MQDALYLTPAPMAEMREAKEFSAEFCGPEDDVLTGAAPAAMDFSQWIERAVRGDAPAEDTIPSDIFFARAGGRIVGVAEIRHNLDNVFLATYGGHIGYAVRPCARRKGYAARILRLALTHARFLGLSKVMLTCFADNPASRAAILRCGGVLRLTNTLHGRAMELYLIDLRRYPSSRTARTTPRNASI